MYAILRTEKLKSVGNIGGIGSHVYRQRETVNADKKRTCLNVSLKGSENVVSDYKHRLGDTPIRANNVLAIDMFLGASPEFFQGKSKEDIINWSKDNLEFLEGFFGEENVVNLCLHLDETTPHLHAMVVPLVNEKLNCRSFLGGRSKMQDLQTKYADFLQKKGWNLKRGKIESIAEHKTIKKYYEEANRTNDLTLKHMKKMAVVPAIPRKTFFEKKEDFDKREKVYRSHEFQRKKRVLETAVSKAVALETAQERISALENQLMNRNEENDDLRIRLSEAYEKLGLTKEEISFYRKTDLNLIAKKLDYYGEILPKENGIDLVMRVENFDYKQAVAWLYHELPDIALGREMTDFVKKAAPAKPFTKSANKIKQLVIKQLDALGISRGNKIRITVQSENSFLAGKVADVEKFFDRDSLISYIPYLKTQNDLGKNIFIMPDDTSAYYVLLDDMTVNAEFLAKNGFKPCLIQRSSWESTQAVFKIPRDDSRYDRKTALAVFREMNQKWGDPKIQALKHSFRLAGFRNRKEKHLHHGKYPFTEILSASNCFCDKTASLCEKRYQAGLKPDLTLSEKSSFKPAGPKM